MPSPIQDPLPHDMQLDAGRGLLAAAAKCALSRIFCISPVTGLTDRKRLVQQLTQNETSAELPANICIGYLAGSTGPTGLLRASVSDRPYCADLTNILPSFSLFWMLIPHTVKQQEHVSK